MNILKNIFKKCSYENFVHILKLLFQKVFLDLEYEKKYWKTNLSKHLF